MFGDNGGYYKFPNGLIMQWGISSTYKPLEIQNIVFPTPFPHKVLSVSFTQSLEVLMNGLLSNIEYANGNNDYGTWLLLKSRTGFSYYSESVGPDNSSQSFLKIHWFAIGY